MHLGDGVFAYFDGHGIELRLHHPANRCAVYLESETTKALIRFWASRELIAQAAAPSPAQPDNPAA